MPDPDIIIADVGATVVFREGLAPVQPIQQRIESRWVGFDVVINALKDVPGLTPQLVPQERRCSFYLDDPSLVPEIESIVSELGCDVLLSADRYLDVLPSGVSKGETLQQLIRYLGIHDQDVLVAGDTLNDYSLFVQSFRGVVVGHSEAGLKRATANLPNVMQATKPGAGGILEAIRAFDYEVPEDMADSDMVSGDAPLVVVYHRLPFDEHIIAGKRVRRPISSPNGIIPTLLGCFEGGRRGSWVAWSINSHGDQSENSREVVDPNRFPNLTAATVSVTEHDVQRFYKRFSKEAFWPVIFSFIDRAKFSISDWEHFLEINRRFAERTAVEADTNALVWLHDYNLWMVPAFLRQLRPDVRIGFFHHTSFPPADVFNVIPWAGQIAGSLAQCDYVGFHIPRYVANFVDVLQSHVPTEILNTVACAPRFRVHGVGLAVGEVPTHIRVAERTIKLGAHPVGVNVKGITEILSTPEASERYDEIRRKFAGTTLILSVERLDYVKGPIQKVEAFERLLELHPELCGKVTLVFVTTPPAAGMEIYDETREAVDEVVGRINGRLRTLDWTPVHYLFRTLPFEEVLVYNAAADVAWITPLRDGLNLVAKEFVVAQQAVNGSGVLVLSEFAGVAAELYGAVLTNPYNAEGLCDDLYKALRMSHQERRQRLSQLARVVEQNDVSQWSREVLESIADPDAPVGN